MWVTERMTLALELSRSYKFIIRVERRLQQMKPVISILCLMVLACILSAQTNLNRPSRKVVSVGYKAKSGTASENGMVNVRGREVQTVDSPESLVTCRGECEMTVRNVILKADELDFHQDTGEAAARGNVTVSIVPLGAATVAKESN